MYMYILTSCVEIEVENHIYSHTINLFLICLSILVLLYK